MYCFDEHILKYFSPPTSRAKFQEVLDFGSPCILMLKFVSLPSHEIKCKPLAGLNNNFSIIFGGLLHNIAYK